ncbi:hypothetical protein EOA32_01615 [Mesorhizobium sp. M1A.F.Ca.ET.072.01.1.1]|uniref:hypothetical protein n=1 Tax=Mesorhizobium sp. M1A.F.Ca.ET.072.01.1.1 TaxID=2496753 RepID=UPI000FD5DF22|nr:hypothetical protein [Mesorhizobium sp. M1A.F.Ca.ET.072.01.1.1]RUW55474.1 hypothetical protein EOA32_01615 [Mesorhizobium sp. M1A.F.Ca.ET.072.01.1.1]TIV04615.1 MAG: hypothetical protein E5W04_02655 [Mesorhizobium sp.]
MARPRSRHRAGSSRGKGTGAVVGAILLGLASLAMLSGFIWLNVKARDVVETDAKTGCPVKGRPNSVTAVLFDTSDPVPQATMEDLANKFRQIAGSIKQGGYLWVGTLTPTVGNLNELFARCNPGDGSTVDVWTSNPGKHQRIWEEAFDKPLKQIPAELSADSQADQSPIMAGIQKVKLGLFDNGMFDNVPKRLVIVSDMLENTPVYSQYKSGADYDVFKKSPANSRYRTDLLGAEVTILYLNRPERKFPSVDHVDFWTRWFSENGGNLSEFIKLEGM